MDSSAPQANGSTSELRARWLALKETEPGLRPRDAAMKLGVTEAELVASRCGDGVRRLAGPWRELIRRLPAIGTVMTLTRNESAVHEKTGRFDRISFYGDAAVVLNRDIDLRIFFNRWRSGFAVVEETRSGTKQSLQFFGGDGMAVHKVYLREDSDARAFESLVVEFMHPDQSPGQLVLRWEREIGDRPDREIDRAALRERWLALKDVHDFNTMLRALGAGRVQAFRLVGEDYAYRVATDSFQAALAKAAASGLPVMVFVGNPGTIQIHTGEVHRLKETGPWYNVLDPGFNLHLRTDQVADAWMVRKPTADGIVTSLEIFDADGQQIAWMFGERGPGEPERDAWRGLVDTLEADPARIR